MTVSVFVTHLTLFYIHTRYINEWAELHCSDVCSQHICFPLLHFFQTLCLIHLALNPSSYNQIILKSVSVMSSVLRGIARSTSGRLRRPERGEATSPTGTGSGKCSHSHAGLLLFLFAIHRSVVFQKAVHPISLYSISVEAVKLGRCHPGQVMWWEPMDNPIPPKKDPDYITYSKG